MIFDREGSVVRAGGKYYGPRHTNNVAEARAMVDGLAEMSGCITPAVKSVVVKGDSDLVIGFMTRRFKPKKRELTLLVKAAWEAVKGWKHVRAHFYHVPRDLNQAADWLSKLARDSKGEPDLRDLSTCKRGDTWRIPPPLGLSGPGVQGGSITLDASECSKALVSWESVGNVGVSCHKCGTLVESRVYQCGGCAKAYHGRCLGVKELP